MPIFDIKPKKAEEVEKVTFDKREDYKVVILVNDAQKTEHLVHKTHADFLIKNKKATEVKDVKLETREIETVVTPVKVD